MQPLVGFLIATPVRILGCTAAPYPLASQFYDLPDHSPGQDGPAKVKARKTTVASANISTPLDLHQTT